ncbi:glutathione S-transferase A-like [Pholidichthys leucotaenia]
MASDMTLLWGSGSPPCWRVMIVLEEKGLQGYNQKLLSFEKGEHKSECVMKMNPRGQLPAFKIKDYVLNESCAACFFLECQYQCQGSKLTPECPAEKARMLQRIFEANNLGQKMGDVIYYNWKVPEDERHDSAVKRNKDALREELKLWENYLQKGNFMAGKSFTLADVVVFPLVAYGFRNGLCQERYSNLARYYNELKARPSIKTTWPPTWIDTCPGETLKDI